MTKKKYGLDVFRLLEALDKRDFNFYKNLSDDEKKSFAGIVAMRWMSSVTGPKSFQEYHIIAVNEVANKHFWNSALANHPELQYLLLARAGTGQKMRHEWIKGPSNKSNTKVYEFLKRVYPTANDDEYKLFLEMNTANDLVDLAKMMGMQDDEIKDLKKELKKVYE